MNLIRSINWIITNKCNSRCIHCDIWRLKSDLTMPNLNIKRVLNDPLVVRSYKHYGHKFDISLGGGEPFLIDNLQGIVSMIEKKFPGSFKSITTNGLCSRKIVDFVQKNKKLRFKIIISIDGIDRAHDRIRGIDGSFNKTIKTILKIKKINLSQQLELKMTLIPENYNQITKVHKLAGKLGCDFTFKPAENIKSYTNKLDNIGLNFTKEQLCIIRNQSFIISDQMRRYGKFKKAQFFQDIPFYLSSTKKPRRCSVLDNDIIIMPDGKIYTCLLTSSIGNINKKSLESLWQKRKTNFKKCPSCMLLCGSYKDYTEDKYEKKVANIETTLRCNLDCKMCTQRELRKKQSTDMSIGIFKKTVNNYPDVNHVSFVGGEPFLNKEFFNMMGFLDSKGITYEMTTNGTLMHKKTIDRLKECVGLEKINFSLDGLQHYHDSERGKGVFKKCIGALKQSANFFNINVCTVMKEDNIDEIPKLTRHLDDFSIKNQKIIYGMNIDKDSRKKSKEIMPYPNMVCDPRFLRKLKQQSINKRNPEIVRNTYQRTLGHYQSLLDIEEIKGIDKDKITFRFYQVAGIKFLLEKKCAILADTPEMGKMIQAIAAALNAYDGEGVRKILIVCPSRGRELWEEEIRTKTIMRNKTTIISGSRRKINKEIEEAKKSRFVIVHYEGLRNRLTVAELKKLGFDFIIVDEAHELRNETLHVKALRSFNAEYKILSTATPLIGRSVMKLFNLLNWLYPKRYSSRRGFKRHFSGSLERIIKLHKELSTFMIRRRKEDVLDDLPVCTSLTIEVALREAQRKVYRRIWEDFKEWVKKYAREERRPRKAVVLAKIMQARQACLKIPRLKIQGPSIENPAENYQRIAKLFKALEYLEKRNCIFIEFEPSFIKSNLKDFLNDKSLNNRAISCRQIHQYRFDTKGRRIICEFIRNKFNLNTADYLSEDLLPICQRCCKLQLLSRDERATRE